MLEKINTVKEEFEKDIKEVNDLKGLEEFRIEYLSRNGRVSELFEEMKNIPNEEKPAVGKELNIFRGRAQKQFDSIKEELEKEESSGAADIDLSLPGKKYETGRIHLLSQTINRINEIFSNMGFSVIEGPEIESDYYNFEALNFPPDHPARDMQDTYFLNENFVMRTHTTPVQVRIMENYDLPVRAIMPGKVFRNEAISARSMNIFHQVDGIYVDKDVTFSELKGTMVSFANQFYGGNFEYRFRTSFFPFTEPSAEMDIKCINCGGSGCRICKHTGWLEILGCGMVDPNVLKAVNIDSEEWTGYAFGIGIERTVMNLVGINDIRVFFDNDIRFLKQF